MSVKNLIIRDCHGKIIRNWDMFEHGTNEVYDDVYHCPALVTNGVWEADRHIRWVQEMSLKEDRIFRQIAVDSSGKRIFVARRDTLYILYPGLNRIDRIKTEGEPFNEVYSQLIYDGEQDRLISYNTDPFQVIFYNLRDNKWSDVPRERMARILHHNRIIDPESRHLFIIGGYGFFNYRAELVECDLEEQHWDVQDLKEQLTPRYLASLGGLKNHQILLFGGYGSTTGLQEEFSHNLYDLCRIDLQTKECVNLGKVSDIEGHYTFGNSMVVDEDAQKFYTLGYRNDLYQSSIHLFEVDMKDLSSRMLADSIAYHFQDTEAFCDLFLSSDSLLYAVVCQHTGKYYEVGVYSLKYPPLEEHEVIRGVAGGHRNFMGGWLLLGVVVLFGGGAIYCKKRFSGAMAGPQHKEKVIPAAQEENPQITEDAQALAGQFIPEMNPGEMKRKASSVSLLGGFQIIDAQGNDITGHFTPVIRQLFLVTLLETVSTGKGITSEALNELFWFDMDKTQATNNRNVNIRKLRLLLEKLGAVTLQKTNSYWQVNFGEGIFCDYTEVMELLYAIRSHNRIDKGIVEKVVGLANRGVLLPNLDVEWGDKYKSEYSTLLIEMLVKAAAEPDVKSDLRLLIRLADVILLHDSIDEDSIRIKCCSLYQLGQKGLSKQCYDKYCSDYRSILNEDPTVKYEDLITCPDL